MITVAQINEQLHFLPPKKLAVVYDFVTYLRDRRPANPLIEPESEVMQVLFASEEVLARDWNLPEEDAAWADL